MKMRTQKTSQKKLIFITATAIIILLLGAAALTYHFQTWPFHTSSKPTNINLEPATHDQIKAGETTKKTSVESSAGKQNTSGSDQPPVPTQEPGNAKSQVEMTITATNQNNATLQIRTLISTVVSDGTCTLLLSGPAGQSITLTSSVQPLSSTSTCKGFDVSTSDLSPGTWNVNIQYTDSSLTGSVSKTITIK